MIHVAAEAAQVSKSCQINVVLRSSTPVSWSFIFLIKSEEFKDLHVANTHFCTRFITNIPGNLLGSVSLGVNHQPLSTVSLTQVWIPGTWCFCHCWLCEVHMVTCLDLMDLIITKKKNDHHKRAVLENPLLASKMWISMPPCGQNWNRFEFSRSLFPIKII